LMAEEVVPRKPGEQEPASLVVRKMT
jgi:hypothetical protein